MYIYISSYSLILFQYFVDVIEEQLSVRWGISTPNGSPYDDSKSMLLHALPVTREDRGSLCVLSNPLRCSSLHLSLFKARLYSLCSNMILVFFSSWEGEKYW